MGFQCMLGMVCSKYLPAGSAISVDAVCGGTCSLVQKVSHDHHTSTVVFTGWQVASTDY